MKIVKMNKGNWGKIRAFIDIQTEEGFVIKGFKIIEGINGLFIGFPSQKNNEGEYFPTVMADQIVKDKLTQLALKEYGGDIMTQSAPSPNYYDPGAAPPPQQNAPINSDEAFKDDDIPF